MGTLCEGETREQISLGCLGVSGGKFACSLDKKTRLVCKNNKFVKDKTCKCSVLIDKVNCD